MNKQSSSDNVILKERVRQARWGFNLSVSFAGISGLITITGFVLLLTGRISPSLYGATAGGAASTLVGGRLIKLSSEANDRLDLMLKEEDEEPE